MPREACGLAAHTCTRVNHLDFGDIPFYLPQLTMWKKVLIARVHDHVNVMEIRRQQYKYRAHCFHFFRDTGRGFTQLPHPGLRGRAHWCDSR
jgi:uncharacterized protein DUF6570